MDMNRILFVLALFCSALAPLHAEEVTEVMRAHVYEVLKPKDEHAFTMYKKTIIQVSIDEGITPKGSPDDKIYQAMEIDRLYEKNEIAATNKFNDKPVRIKGKAVEIGLDALNNGYIRIGKGFGYVNLDINKDDPAIQKISSGDTVDMMCKVGEYTFHTLNFKGCVPSKGVEAVIARNRTEGISFNTPDNGQAIIEALLYKTNEKYFTTNCNKSQKKCLSAIKKKFYLDDKGWKKVISDIKKFIEDNELVAWATIKTKLYSTHTQ